MTANLHVTACVDVIRASSQADSRLHLKHRITSLERFGMRSPWDFQSDSVAYAKDAGYTGILVNGGSGMLPDMIAESLVQSAVLPDLMPLSVDRNQREMDRRCGLLRSAELKPWLCLFGIPGPDESCNSMLAPSNNAFDRRTKLEMHAKLQRSPNIFGRREPTGINWRGSRPLCISHSLVQEFYQELFTKLPQRYEDLEGVIFLGGDTGPETCHQHTCPRCQSTGLDPWGRLLRYVNLIYEALQASRPGIEFYFLIWNQIGEDGSKNISRFLASLHPGIGIGMSLSDNTDQSRKAGVMTFTQPWSILSSTGGLFLETVEKARSQGRPFMALGEISQSEVWDPVCHNVPLPLKTVQFLRNVVATSGVDSILDFWGNRPPYISHSNHHAMRCYLQSPGETLETLLDRAAVDHYGIPSSDSDLLQSAIECWSQFDSVVDNWCLTGWSQRFSFAIGRDAARGRLYEALIPPFLKDAYDIQRWEIQNSILQRGKVSPSIFSKFQAEDKVQFENAASNFRLFAEKLTLRRLFAGAYLAFREADTILLAGELTNSVGRTVLAVEAYRKNCWKKLRSIIEEEIAARERQLEITGRLGWGAGINPLLVEEDLQNMRFYLSSDDYPHTASHCFQLTHCPYVA